MTRAADDESRRIAAARAGDERAFDAILADHRDRVFTVALAILRNRDLADEITQDVFVRLFRALPSFREESRLATWLHRVAVNACMDVLRRRDRGRLMVPMTDEIESRTADTTDPDEARALRQAVQRLPPDLRVAVSLRYAAGLTYAEIARTLAWPLGTVCTRLHRALKTLHDDLAPDRPMP